MKRIKTIENIEHIKIDREAYLGFHMYMQTNINELKQVLSQRGAIEAVEFSKLINKYVKKDYIVERDEVDIIVKLLDTDNSGFIQKKEIFGILKNLEYYTSVKSGENTFFESLKKDFQLIVEKGKKILEIIDE